MTPYEVPREECANFVGRGCIFSDPRTGRKEGVCALTGMKAPCRYFEAAVLPLVDRMPQYAGVRNAYRDAFRVKGVPALPRMSAEEVRRCPCGKSRAAGHTYCPECAMERRRALARERVRKHREGQTVAM